MTDTNSVTVRFGGDAAGLSAAAAVAKAQLNAVNAEMKKLAKEAAGSGGANDNLTKQMREVAVAAQKAKAELASLSGGFRENKGHVDAHTAALGLNRQQAMEFAHIARALGDEVAAGGSLFRGLAMESGRLSQALAAGPGGVAGSLAALGAIAARFLPLIGVAAAGAAAGLSLLAGSKVQEDLVKLGETMRQTALSANQLKGAEIIGAKNGVGSDDMAKALQNANQQWELFKRNAGEIKARVELIAPAFLKVLDGARNSGQAIDLVAQKVRSLPREEGLDLVKAVFGDETGEKLYAPIMRGEVSVKQFAAAAKEAGVDIQDGVVDGFVKLQREVDDAVAKADGKFKSAMQDIAVLVADIKTAWHGFVEGISAAISKVGGLYGEFQKLRALAADKDMGGGTPVPFTNPIWHKYRRPGASAVAPAAPEEAAGKSRARYEAYKDAQKSSSESSPIENYIESLQKAAEQAKAELDSWGKGNVERQKAVALAQAESAARREGRALTEAERQKVIELATAGGQYKQQLEDVKAVQQELSAAMSSFANDLASAFDSALIKGEKLNQVLKNLVASLASSALKGLVTGALTGQGPFGQALFGQTPQGQLGGLFGAASSGLGLSNLFSGVTSGGGLLGGLFSGLATALPFLDSGTNFVPHDMIAQIHQGERVVPAADNRALTAALAGGAGGGATVHAPVNFTIQAADSQDVLRALNGAGGKAIMKMIADHVRAGAHLGLGLT